MRIVVVVALAAASLAACDRAAPDPRGVGRNETLLTVSASGRADTRPDEARLQLGVQSQAGSAGEASRRNREKMDKVTAELTRLGVKSEAIQTRNLSLQRIDHGPERGRFRAYNTVEVMLRDMTKVGDAVTAVTEAGANVLSGPDLRVSNREAANRSAYAEAYKAARARAEAYASAADLEIARVLAIYDGGERNVPPPYARYGSSMDAVAQTAAPPPPQEAAPFSPGVNITEVQVRVDFALAEK
ncbi:SIMPL domain-containing protein [Sphingomonas sp.]|uniref:SIMPL domain-containing protein n=1 Tax=Sphingomonas sp. TaxID=28214 RepID=UPI001808CB0A|nr:SIMPL domain-containing protein [Sphingomonas sp.]MBA3511164.1 SIMPL domain-containing protein [Sphingomonas sp.]